MKIVFATNNPNKLREIQNMVPENIQLVSLSDIGCHEDIPETQNTIEGNAQQKAAYIKENYGLDCFADDTGLEVKALNGRPGVYSARYAGDQRSPEDNIHKLLMELDDEQDRTAQFKTVIALELNNSQYTFTGICRGSITKEKFGEGGFGYDPVFRAENYERTFAEISLAEKNKIGHRGKAMKQLIEFLEKQ